MKQRVGAGLVFNGNIVSHNITFKPRQQSLGDSGVSIHKERGSQIRNPNVRLKATLGAGDAGWKSALGRKFPEILRDLPV
jgi:hypothetical protein